RAASDSSGGLSTRSDADRLNVESFVGLGAGRGPSGRTCVPPIAGTRGAKPGVGGWSRGRAADRGGVAALGGAAVCENAAGTLDCLRGVGMRPRALVAGIRVPNSG